MALAGFAASAQRTTSVTLPDPDAGGGLAAPVWTYAYNAAMHLASVTDPLGHNTNYGYDDYGRLVTETNHQGWVTTTAYNLLDQVTSVTTPDPDGAGGVTASTTNCVTLPATTTTHLRHRARRYGRGFRRRGQANRRRGGQAVRPSVDPPASSASPPVSLRCSPLGSGSAG